MTRLPALKADQVIKALNNAGFAATRQKGSHIRFKHDDGRGLLRKILRDTEMTVDQLLKLLQ
jgi:predicted RNA binding protein YcfA (HicA-like mRNA interferase family)